MTTLNAIEPTPEQIKKFLSDKKAGEPVYMLNLLKFKDRATYKSGENVSGREAYARYASAFSKLVKDKKLKNLKSMDKPTKYEKRKNYQQADENFADGKNPERKGLSKRVGIPQGATLAQLEKIAKNSTGEKRRMAQWQLNMRRGKAKKNK